MARQYVLSIDGGGIRGILPLYVLAKLEQVTKLRSREIFSFVAGTSAGAIIAAGLAAGIPAAQLIELYVGAAGKAFAGPPWKLLKRFIPGYMYSTQTLNTVIREALGPASAWTLNDSPINLLITAVRLQDGKPWYFVKDNPRNKSRTGHLKLADCATASAAAPTFFAPWPMPEAPSALRAQDHPIGTLVDGGVSVTGNPVYQACIEAFDYTVGYLPEETIVVSLGTGRFLDRSRPAWIGAWLNWVLGEMLRSPGEQQTAIVRRQFQRTLCYRLDPPLPSDIALDGTGQVPLLRSVGAEYAAGVDWLAILNGRESPFLHEPRSLP